MQGSHLQECQSEFWLLGRILVSSYTNVKLEYLVDLNERYANVTDIKIQLVKGFRKP